MPRKGSTVFFAGLPTDIDIRALTEAFGVPEEGDSISYDEIANTIKVPVGSNRYHTVVGQWRKRLQREHNIYMKAGDGRYEVLDPAGRVDLGASKLRTGARMFRKAHVVVESTDRKRLTPQQRARADHIQMTTATAIQSARLASKKPTAELPQAVSK